MTGHWLTTATSIDRFATSSLFSSAAVGNLSWLPAQLGELQTIFPALDLFAVVVVENGAVLFDPKSRESKVLCEPPRTDFVQKLREHGVAPLSVGRAIVATFRPNESAVLKVIQEMGLELQVIFNKDAVMILPTGVNKATGLMAALNWLRIKPQETVGVGDAENDHAFLARCGCSAAVANAVPAQGAC